MVVGIVAGVCLLTLIVLLMITPRYTSQVQMLLENRETSFTRPTQDVASFRADKETVASQVQVIKSRDLAMRIIKDLKLENVTEFNPDKNSFLQEMLVLLGFAQDPMKLKLHEKILKTYYKRLKVYQVGNTRVISIEFSSEDPKLAARLVNRLADLYTETQRLAKSDTTREAARWLRPQIEDLRNKVTSAERAVEEYRARHGLVEGRANTSLVVQQLTELNSQLSRARAARSEAQARARLVRSMLRSSGDVEAAADVLRSPLVQRLREQQVRLRRQYAELSAALLPSHPRMVQIRADMANLGRQIKQEASKIVKGLENEARISAEREKELKRSLEELKSESTVAKKAEVKLRELEREARANRELLESYLKKFREASARDKVDAQTANVRIISRGTISSTPSFPKTGPIMLLMLFVSLILGIMVALLKGNRQALVPSLAMQGGDELPSWRDELNAAPVRPRSAPVTPPQGTDYSSLPVLSWLPPLPTRTAASPAYEPGMKDLYKAVFQRCLARQGKRVLITSLNGGASEAETAINLARTMAAHHLKVVLVDADVLDNSLSVLAGLVGKPGFGDLIGGQISFSQAIMRDSASSADIIPAGNMRIDPAVLTASNRMEIVLGALDKSHDFVLIKSTSCYRNELSCYLSGQVHLVALVAGHGAVSPEEITACLDKLGRGHPGITADLAVVITGADDMIIHRQNGSRAA